MRQDKRQQKIAKIEEMQRRAHQRLAHQRMRMDRRFDKMRERLQEAAPNDSQQRIIEAALELLNEDGLANLSLRKLAGKVDMQASALYWHFKNKDVLIDYMAEAILQKEFKEVISRRSDEAWQDWLMHTMLHLRRAMLSYKDGARVVAGAHLFPAFTLGRIFDTSLQSLHSAGFDILESRSIMRTATTYTFGFVIEEQASPTPEEFEKIDLEAFSKNMPATVAAFEAADSAKLSGEDDFKSGLDLIIKGASKL